MKKQNSKNITLHEKARKKILEMSDKDFRNLVYDTLSMQGDRALKMFIRKEKKFIQRVKQKITPESILKKVKKISRKHQTKN